MKKRAMKKWIPKDTDYCGSCKWRRYIKTIFWHARPLTTQLSPPEEGCEWTQCDISKECESNQRCWMGATESCFVHVYRCEYLGLTDTIGDTLLWDGCKECDEHMPKWGY